MWAIVVTNIPVSNPRRKAPMEENTAQKKLVRAIPKREGEGW